MIRASGNIEIIYEYGALRFTKNNEENGFNKDNVTDMSWYLRKENKFEILSEEDEEIDIQSIEELAINYKECVDLGNNNTIFDYHNNTRTAINELIKAVKKLDKKIKEEK